MLAEETTSHSAPPLYAGLFLVALAALALEIVLTRLLSAITWYHLAFLAISLAMLGLAAGAVYTYLGRRRLPDERLPRALTVHALAFALAAPACHLLLLELPIPVTAVRQGQLLQLFLASAVTAVPFFFAGVAIALALTRFPGAPIGRLYAADLIGAGLGCLLAVPLLDRLDPTSAIFAIAALAAAGAAAFARLRPAGGSSGAGAPVAPALRIAAVAAVLLLGGLGFLNHALYPSLFRVTEMKGQRLPARLAVDRWNSHSRVTAPRPRRGEPAFWGAPRAPEGIVVRQLPLRIDGGAFTVATALEGEPAQLDWLAHDVTSLPYQLRPPGEPAGRVAVIGVGGGRDLLTALSFGSRHVVGIEINRILIELIERDYRDLLGLAGRPEVELVHSEGRSYLASQSPDQAGYDIIQMALVDTWAATAAGAMTLTENGLYTTEAWRLFLDRLAPGGTLAVSRWYRPDRPGETARLLALASAALIESGVERPSEHLVLAGGERVATLIVRREPFESAELARLERAAERYGFEVLARPGAPPSDALLAPIAAADDLPALARATAHPRFDLSPPSDDRPFFFNMLKPTAWLALGDLATDEAGGVIAGNLRATGTLLAILAVVSVLALAVLIVPLLVFGRRHGLGGGGFAAAAGYFSLIGLGFMLVEIALIQRFSILLGHPVRSLAVTLMSMIVFTGLGSLASDRLPSGRGTDRPERRLALLAWALPAAAALGAWIASGPIAAAAVGQPLAVRVAAVLLVTAPLGLLLGLPFPLGMRLLRRRSPAALSWMWGLNGAFGVVGSVLAVIVSMNLGIAGCLLTGAACYLALGLPAFALGGRDATIAPSLAPKP